MIRSLHHTLLIGGLFFLLFPILFFQSEFVFSNYVTDLPVLFLLNLILLIYFIEFEVRKYKYQSIFLLIISAVAVFSSFFRIIPLPVGITLAFLLPIASGIVFGEVIGFITGQLSMLVGGIFLGAFGPWMPYQAFLMGVVGFYAGFFFHRRHDKQINRIAIIAYAVITSFLYGYWMSITSWPVVVKDSSVPADWSGKIKLYNEYYLVTSAFWDMTRAAGNIIIFAIFLKPACDLLERAKIRLTHSRM